MLGEFREFHVLRYYDNRISPSYHNYNQSASLRCQSAPHLSLSLNKTLLSRPWSLSGGELYYNLSTGVTDIQGTDGIRDRDEIWFEI